MYADDRTISYHSISGDGKTVLASEYSNSSADGHIILYREGSNGTWTSWLSLNDGSDKEGWGCLCPNGNIAAFFDGAGYTNANFYRYNGTTWVDDGNPNIANGNSKRAVFSDDGKYFLIRESDDIKYGLFEYIDSTWTRIRTITHEHGSGSNTTLYNNINKYVAMSFSRDGLLYAIAEKSDTIKIYTTANETDICTLSLDGRQTVELKGDASIGYYLLYANTGNTIYIKKNSDTANWTTASNWEDFKTIRPWENQTSGTNHEQKMAAKMTPDATKILVANYWQDIKLLTIPTAKVKGTNTGVLFTANDDYVSSMIDVSFNMNLYVGGDLSWNPASSIADDSIPQSAIIGGVGSNHFVGDVSMNNDLLVVGDVSMNNNLEIVGGITAGTVSLTTSQVANSTTSGTLQVDGGVGITGSLYVGSDLSWNPTNIANDSIYPSAIIGGVGSNDLVGDVSITGGDLSMNQFIKQF